MTGSRLGTSRVTHNAAPTPWGGSEDLPKHLPELQKDCAAPSRRTVLTRENIVRVLLISQGGSFEKSRTNLWGACPATPNCPVDPPPGPDSPTIQRPKLLQGPACSGCRRGHWSETPCAWCETTCQYKYFWNPEDPHPVYSARRAQPRHLARFTSLTSATATRSRPDLATLLI
jgi:hypothetical protein